MIRRPAALGALAVLALATAPATATPATDPYDGQIRYSFAPYIWVPGVDGDFKFTTPGGVAGVHAGPADILGALKFTFMGNADVREGRWSAFTDFIYIDLSTNKASVRTITSPGGAVAIPINLNNKIGLEATEWSVAGAYTIYHDAQFSADGFVGFRLMDSQPSLDWHFTGPAGAFAPTGHLSAHSALWDGIVGLKGRLYFTPESAWFADYYGDIGGGTSDLTAQVLGGIGYAFGWGDVTASYRYVYYSPGETPPLIANLNLQGLALGVRFRF